MQFKFGTPFQDYLFSRVLQGNDPQVVGEEGTSGYWGKPVAGLDPRLVDDTGNVRQDVRTAILDELHTFWGQIYLDSDKWSTAWIAGSALSHQFAEHTQPDLDVLIGVDYPMFYAFNPAYRGLSATALSDRFNNEFREFLDPKTAEWNGFELTFYVNPGATDIRSINPYAAYDLTHDEWTVRPIDVPEDWDPKSYFSPEWWTSLNNDVREATALVEQFHRVADQVRRLPAGDPVQLSRLAELRRIGGRAVESFNDIHGGRRKAFNDSGKGYFDYNNLRWQVHKRAGTVKALNDIAKIYKSSREYQQKVLYGAPLETAEEALVGAQTAHSSLASTSWYRRKLHGQ